MAEYKFHISKVGPLVSKVENCLREPKNELRTRRLKNFYAEAKYFGISLPAFRALLDVRKRLRVARNFMEKLPPHRRAEVAKLAEAIGDKSDVFGFEPADPASFDVHLAALR